MLARKVGADRPRLWAAGRAFVLETPRRRRVSKPSSRPLLSLREAKDEDHSRATRLPPFIAAAMMLVSFTEESSMTERKYPPQRPAHTIRRGSVEVSLWKWSDGCEIRYELTVNRFYAAGEKQPRYPERFRADHIPEVCAAIDEAASWVQDRGERLAQVRKLFRPQLA